MILEMLPSKREEPPPSQVAPQKLASGGLTWCSVAIKNDGNQWKFDRHWQELNSNLPSCVFVTSVDSLGQRTLETAHLSRCPSNPGGPCGWESLTTKRSIAGTCQWHLAPGPKVNWMHLFLLDSKAEVTPYDSPFRGQEILVPSWIQWSGWQCWKWPVSVSNHSSHSNEVCQVKGVIKSLINLLRLRPCFSEQLYQIDPREAVPEVSKGKGYINQEKMCL